MCLTNAPARQDTEAPPSPPTAVRICSSIMNLTGPSATCGLAATSARRAPLLLLCTLLAAPAPGNAGSGGEAAPQRYYYGDIPLPADEYERLLRSPGVSARGASGAPNSAEQPLRQQANPSENTRRVGDPETERHRPTREP